ncbi:MAG: hypothetical protein KDC93_13215 [Cyclobacteriaceae bacterium]|nr:hypothetical protein [Cyclobacteriaceae bacterium]
MKKYNFILTLILILGFALAGNKSYAQTETKGADVRQKAQRVRIADGRLDGEVTRREAAALNAEQRHIRRAERRAKADGEVTRVEKRKLERKQNRANRHIRRAKHNEIDNN